MRSKTLLRTLGTALLCASPAVAGNPVPVPAGGPGCAPAWPPPSCATPWTSPATPGTQQAPGTQTPGGVQPDSQQPNANQQPSTDAFAQAPPSGGETAQSALPNMIGDLGFYGVGPRSSQSFFFPTSTTITQNIITPGLTPAQINQRFNLSPQFPTPGFAGQYFDLTTGQRFTAAQLTALSQPTVTPRTVVITSSQSSSSQSSSSSLQSRVPVTNFGSFKISENESVAPTDRVFATYNYYNVDGFHGNSSSINREVIGFEKTFLDGAASFGIRAPYTEVGEGLGGTSEFDALSLIFKYAFFQNRETGTLLSGGLVVTVPTGQDIGLGFGSPIDATLLQPYVGYSVSFGRFYVEGFSEIIVPTDTRLSTFVANDIGIGYRLEAIPVIPTFEVHSNNALNHQGSDASPLGFVDQVILTGGVHTLIGNSILTLGVATPVTGPRLNSVEAVVQFNWHF